MKNHILFLFLIVLVSSCTQPPLPPWFTNAFNQQKLNRQYELNGYLHPPYLLTDIDGDGKTDVAILIDEIKTKKKGLLIMQDEGRKYFVFGAGEKMENGTDDLKWAHGWNIYNSKTWNTTPYNKNDDIPGEKDHQLFVYEPGGKGYDGWIILWEDDRKEYIWIEQKER